MTNFVTPVQDLEDNLDRARRKQGLMDQLFIDQANEVARLETKLEANEALSDWLKESLEKSQAENARLRGLCAEIAGGLREVLGGLEKLK